MKVKENTVIVTGYIHKNFVNAEGTVLTFSLGIDDSYFKDNKWVNRTSWVQCKIFNKERIERLKDILNEVEVLVHGNIKSEKYEKDGKDVFNTYISPTKISVIFDKKNSDSANDDGYEGIDLSGIEDEN